FARFPCRYCSFARVNDFALSPLVAAEIRTVLAIRMTCNRDRTANVLTPPNPFRDYLQRVGEFLNRIPRYRCATRSEVSLVSLIPAESKKLYTHIVFLSMFLHRCRRVIPKKPGR